MTRVYAFLAIIGAALAAVLGAFKMGARSEAADKEIETLKANAAARERIDDAIIDNDTGADARRRLLERNARN